MPTTTKGFRYPASSAAPNVPQDVQNLATDLDTFLYLGDRFKWFQKSVGVSTNTHTVMSDIVTGTWTSAPAGDYLIHTTLTIDGTAAGGNIEVKVGATTISRTNHRADVAVGIVNTITNVHPYTAASAGTLTFALRHGPSSGTATTYNSGCQITVQYLGRRV